jgi:hypothetical protein
MKKLAITIFVVAAAAFTFGANAKKTILSVHKQFEAAMNRNDFAQAKKVVLAGFADSFRAKGMGPEMTRKEFVDNLVPPGGRVSSYHFEIGSVAEKGDIATVKAKIHFKGSFAGSGGKAQPIDATESIVETWTKIKGAWKMTSMVQG